MIATINVLFIESINEISLTLALIDTNIHTMKI